ncbi:MAG: hypothetical protein HFJ27_04765 [Clostridia bacterium]|nr:hypothetical protein [Clostridia bacterium]
MKIGIDIDDVITNTSETIEEYVMKNNNSQKLQEHMKEIMKGNPSDPEVIEFCMETYLKVFQKVKLKDNAKEVIQRLLDKENEIYLITARGENLEFFKGSEKVTKEFLEDNNIKYTKIFFNAIDKAPLCIDNQIDVMIDDSIVTNPVSETEVLNHFGLTKKDGYIVGFNLGSKVSNIKSMLSSYPNVRLSSFKDASGKEISEGSIATNMQFVLTFNDRQYHYTVVVKGDVNGDGSIYATDYVRIQNHIMGKTTLTGAYLKAADINNDNNVYATDYVKIKNYIMGKGSISQEF